VLLRGDALTNVEALTRGVCRKRCNLLARLLSATHKDHSIEHSPHNKNVGMVTVTTADLDSEKWERFDRGVVEWAFGVTEGKFLPFIILVVVRYFLAMSQRRPRVCVCVVLLYS